MCFLQHRIAYRRVLALIVRWLRTGVLENGKRTPAKEGTPHAPISPLLANIYLRLRLEKARQLLRQTDMSVLGASLVRAALRRWSFIQHVRRLTGPHRRNAARTSFHIIAGPCGSARTSMLRTS